MGWEVSFFFAVAVLDVVATPVEEGGPTLPLWGGVVTLGYFVFWCVGVLGMEVCSDCGVW